MRYYKYTALLLLLLLCSCSNVNDKNEKSDTQSVTEQNTTETTAVTSEVTTSAVTTTANETIHPQTTAETESDAPKTFPVQNGADGEEVRNHYSFKVQPDGVWVYYDDIKAEFFSTDCCWYDSNSDYNEQKLDYWHDYNFDGYFDLFIPEGEAVYSGKGQYFRFNVETGLFEIWDEMNKLGIWADTRKFPDKIVYTNINDENNNGEQKTYIWDDEQLVLIKREYHYLAEETEEGHYYIYDYYTYENGCEELYRRRRLYYRNGGEWPSVDEDLPIE